MNPILNNPYQNKNTMLTLFTPIAPTLSPRPQRSSPQASRKVGITTTNEIKNTLEDPKIFIPLDTEYELTTSELSSEEDHKESYKSTPTSNEVDQLFPAIYKMEKAKLTTPKDPDEETGPQDQLSPTTTKRIVIAFAERNGATEEEALMAITRLVQDGGTNSSKPSLKRNIKGKTYDLQDLRQIIQIYSKTGTVRKLAKTLRNIISHIAIINS
jgi:hypothetical protein